MAQSAPVILRRRRNETNKQRNRSERAQRSARHGAQPLQTIARKAAQDNTPHGAQGVRYSLTLCGHGRRLSVALCGSLLACSADGGTTCKAAGKITGNRKPDLCGGGSLWLSKGFLLRRHKRPRARHKNGARGRTGRRAGMIGTETAAADVKRGKAAGSAGRISSTFYPHSFPHFHTPTASCQTIRFLPFNNRL